MKILLFITFVTLASGIIVFQNLVRALSGDHSDMQGMDDFIEWIANKKSTQNYEKRSDFVGYL